MSNLKKQQGAVLFIAMILLPMLAALGLLLMSSTSMDLKMTDARRAHNESRIILNSVVEEFLSDVTQLNKFKSATDLTTFSSTLFVNASGAEVTATTQILVEVDCKRRRNANSNDFKCKYLQLDLSHQFGRAKNSTQKWGMNHLGLGIEQPLLSENR